ncbi:MAG: single-stranded DNA-binding protein [Proteobacteria bacterium]|jgi:single-strand DNA-binding protein|nr:single-stranded DNA-binding protein [Pseudomonadota bacterium]
MAGSLNRVMIIGNLGQDPELRYTANQTPVVTFSVATTDFRTGADGQRQDVTEWHRVVVWSKAAENCAKYLAKGRTVFIEGKLQTRQWDDKQSGQKRYTTEIVAQNVQFLSPNQNAQPRGEYGQAGASFTPRQNNQMADGPGNAYGGPSIPEFDLGSPSSMPSASFGGGSDASLDDIPF